AAMLDLRRLDAWAVSARATTGKVKGSTAAKLIDALLVRPLLSTEDAALATGISRDSAERMLARLLAAGVVREITGQTRFRLWTAAV
ncbi:MAG TPA: helix-turn-helix domain-containing protein, partial [Paenirhodobacter sp.]